MAYEIEVKNEETTSTSSSRARIEKRTGRGWPRSLEVGRKKYAGKKRKGEGKRGEGKEKKKSPTQ